MNSFLLQPNARYLTHLYSRIYVCIFYVTLLSTAFTCCSWLVASNVEWEITLLSCSCGGAVTAAERVARFGVRRLLLLLLLLVMVMQ